MKTLILASFFLFVLSVLSSIHAQNCRSTSFGSLIASLKNDLKTNGTDEQLTYSLYPDFNFQDFHGIPGLTNDTIYFEVGINKQGQIHEVTFYNHKYPALCYKLIVHEFQDRRILRIQFIDNKKFEGTPLCIIMFKATNENYFINTAPIYGVEWAYDRTFFNTPKPELNKISIVMELDAALRPTKMLKFSNGQVVVASTFEYGGKVLWYESTHFFFSSQLRPKLKIRKRTCLSQIFDDATRSDLILKLYPEMHGQSTSPLWLFGGAHDYEECRQP
jgi:hypothetical protein